MEGLVNDMAKDPLIARLQSFRGRRVLITGHTGFKGAWLTLWLLELGAEVIGIALDPPTQPNLFDAIDVGSNIADLRHDIRETDALEKIFRATQPEIVFHLAAQPLVRPSYSLARETFDINVMGTVSVLDVVRKTESVRVVIHVGTDKVYENFDQNRPFSETDPLGGHDPYSASKAAAEIVFQSFVRSFYRVAGRPFTASGRAGNVLGGGDWAKDRIVPDAVRALAEKRPIPVRNPDSTRPWQHVLEALSGYLTLAARLMSRDERAVGSWNFGPPKSNVKTVRELVESLIASWWGTWIHEPDANSGHEAKLLALSCEKAQRELDWNSRWNFAETIDRVARWYKGYFDGCSARELCLKDILDYMQGSP